LKSKNLSIKPKGKPEDRICNYSGLLSVEQYRYIFEKENKTNVKR